MQDGKSDFWREVTLSILHNLCPCYEASKTHKI